MTPLGAALLSFLQRPQILKKLKEAAERGTQPVAAISAELLSHFPPEIRDPAVKRRVGFFVAAIMDGEGFSVAQANVRMKNPLFASGAVYRKRSERTTTRATLLGRPSGALTGEEARQVLDFPVAAGSEPEARGSLSAAGSRPRR